MNRIAAAIEQTTTDLQTRLNSGELTQATLEKLNNTLDLNLVELVRFHELKSLAFANGRISFDEATAIYAYLGGSPDHFNRQPIPVKVVLTQTFAELLQPQ